MTILQYQRLYHQMMNRADVVGPQQVSFSFDATFVDYVTDGFAAVAALCFLSEIYRYKI